MTEMREVLINGRWPLRLPEHRAAREEWATGWEPKRLESMYANLHPGDVIYDIGTEEGDLSALFARWVHGVEKHEARDGAGRVVQTINERLGGIVLVEPNPRVWPNIKAIFEGNGLPQPLYCWPGFAADVDRYTDSALDDCEFGPTPWPRCADGPIIGDHGFLNVKESPDVPTITIDLLAELAAHSPTAVTMDVEGAEILVVRGMQRTLETCRPLVWVSVHAEAMFNDWGVYQVEFFSEFHRLGYEKVFLDFDHEAHWFFYPGERRGEVTLPVAGGPSDHHGPSRHQEDQP